MMRYLKILVLAMLAVGLVASGAFAGSIVFSGSGGTTNEPYSVALEAMGGARSLLVTGSDGTSTIVAPVLYITPSQALVSGSLLTFTFTNVAFDSTSPVYLCQLAANNSVTNADGTLPAPIGSATPTANSSITSFVLSSGTSSTFNRVLVTQNATPTNCASNGNLTMRFQPVSSGTMATISYNATIGGTQYDSKAAINIGNIARQYTTSYNATNTPIDFLNAPANGSKFAVNNAYTTQGSWARISNTAKNVNTTDSPASLTVSALLSLQDSASWGGVKSVYIRNGENLSCNAGGTNNAANNSPAGTVNMNIGTGAFNGGTAASGYWSVCAEITGNATVQSRTIKGALDISVTGTGPNDPGMDSYVTLMQWLSNGYQGIIPYASASSTYLTICMINNKSGTSAPITADILSSESGAALTSLNGLSLGTLAAQGTMRVDFASSITPYTYSGGAESAGTPISLTGLESNDRYSAMINVGGSPTQIYVNCIQVDPAGSKRAVPVLTQANSAFPWQQ